MFLIIRNDGIRKKSNNNNDYKEQMPDVNNALIIRFHGVFVGINAMNQIRCGRNKEISQKSARK